MNDKIREMLTRLAIENPGVQGRFKMSAGIVYRKHLIATGVNQYKTHPIMMPENGYREGQIFLHAEIDAIKNALKLITQEQLAKCDLYVLRVKRPDVPWSKDWVYGLAKPCRGCQRMIASFGIQNILYTEDYELTNQNEHVINIM
jgi:deoxycytidylate deaminase